MAELVSVLPHRQRGPRTNLTTRDDRHRLVAPVVSRLNLNVG